MGAMSSTAMEVGALAPDFPSLYRQYFGFAWASLRRLGVSPATIDDAAQDLWVTVHRRLESLDAAASVKAWLFGIARRVASHYRRTEHRHQRKLAAYSVAESRRSSEPMKRREAALTMEVFLGKLDETKRIAFVLSEVEGWSAPEIARVVGTSPNTVYSRVRLARQQLRKHLLQSESELSPTACLEAIRSSTQAPPDAHERCWAALSPKLAGTALTTTAATTATGGLFAKLGLVGLGVLLGGVGVVGLDAALPEASAPPPVVAALAVPEAPPTAAPEAPTTPMPTPAPAVVVPAPVPDDDPPPVQSAPRVSAVAPAPAPTDDLARETQMLTKAKRQLEAGEHVAALATIRAHAEQHPHSSLADLRQVLEVQATCARGQREQAQALAKHHARTASPTTAAKLMAACEPEVSTRTE